MSLRPLARLFTITLMIVGCSAMVACGQAQVTSPQSEPILSTNQPSPPEPPKIPDHFSWSGRYVVPDLGIDVPFVWFADGGDFQMVAGGVDEPIHFTNIIHAGELYTLTYTWPGVPRMPCSHVGSFTLKELNAGFAEASFVGVETLHRDRDYTVHHFRSVSVIDLPAELIDGAATGLPLRIPLMAGDIYVDTDNPGKIRQLLHFGLQNLYDPNLDEWIMIENTEAEAAEVELPSECSTQ